MVECGSTVVQDSAMLSHVIRSTDTVYQHDSVYRHDSIIYREIVRHDTVYITKEVYRDRLETKGEKLKALNIDTIHDTQYVTQVVEKPPKKYVPGFYKWCTAALWAIGLLAIGYWLLKWWVLKR
jgi:hypothetical protein